MTAIVLSCYVNNHVGGDDDDGRLLANIRVVVHLAIY